MKVKTIGILFETIEDAYKIKNVSIYHLDHWREPGEIKAIQSAVERLGFDVILLGTPGHFLENMTEFKKKIDFIFSLSVGFVSRFRQALGATACELAGIPYTGADPYAKILGQNKHLKKSLFDKLRIPTPKWVYIHDENMIKGSDYPPFPLIVKPACEGTSVGIVQESVVTSGKCLVKRIEYLLTELKLPVIVEHFIVGKEFKVGFIGNEKRLFEGMFEDVHNDGSPLGSDFLYFKAKKKAAFKKIHRNIQDACYDDLRENCNKIYSLFCPVDYGVFDIRQDDQDRFYFIEFNVDATLHPEKSLAQCCSLNGVKFDDMISTILHSSFDRWELQWN